MACFDKYDRKSGRPQRLEVSLELFGILLENPNLLRWGIPSPANREKTSAYVCWFVACAERKGIQTAQLQVRSSLRLKIVDIHRIKIGFSAFLCDENWSNQIMADSRSSVGYIC